MYAKVEAPQYFSVNEKFSTDNIVSSVMNIGIVLVWISE